MWGLRHLFRVYGLYCLESGTQHLILIADRVWQGICAAGLHANSLEFFWFGQWRVGIMEVCSVSFRCPVHWGCY